MWSDSSIPDISHTTAQTLTFADVSCAPSTLISIVPLGEYKKKMISDFQLAKQYLNDIIDSNVILHNVVSKAAV